MTDKDIIDEIINMRYKHDISMPNHFCKSVEILCEKQERQMKELNNQMTNKERIGELVIVDKMPDSCYFCKHSHVNASDGASCSLLHGKEIFCNFTDMAMSDRHKDCPLKTIQSIQNQKAVEALKKVKAEFDFEVEEEFGDYACDQDYITLDIWKVDEFLDNLIKELGGNV